LLAEKREELAPELVAHMPIYKAAAKLTQPMASKAGSKPKLSPSS
jgi:hypothetical protein